MHCVCFRNLIFSVFTGTYKSVHVSSPVCLSKPVYLSLAVLRSVVIGSCWIVWWSIRANSPALLVMAVLRFLSCSNSSSSLYHCKTVTQTPCGQSLPLQSLWVFAVDGAIQTIYHSYSLQIHLCSSQFLPAVMFVTLPFGYATEFTCRLKDIFDQWTATHLVSWDLFRWKTKKSSYVVFNFFKLGQIWEG